MTWCTFLKMLLRLEASRNIWKLSKQQSCHRSQIPRREWSCAKSTTACQLRSSNKYNHNWNHLSNLSMQSVVGLEWPPQHIDKLVPNQFPKNLQLSGCGHWRLQHICRSGDAHGAVTSTAEPGTVTALKREDGPEETNNVVHWIHVLLCLEVPCFRGIAYHNLMSSDARAPGWIALNPEPQQVPSLWRPSARCLNSGFTGWHPVAVLRHAKQKLCQIKCFKMWRKK
jgi:hypothetical protein